MAIQILHIGFYSIMKFFVLENNKFLGLITECGASRQNSGWFPRIFCPKVEVPKPLEASKSFYKDWKLSELSYKIF